MSTLKSTPMSASLTPSGASIFALVVLLVDRYRQHRRLLRCVVNKLSLVVGHPARRTPLEPSSPS